MQLSTGDKLGPYEITSLIGKGGMGEVYLGTDTRLGRPVAIKVSAREFNDRFEREARAISALNHPNICTLYDVGPNYLVMEFVEGETLSKIIARGPLPLDKALQYAVQIVDALAAAHAKGVIHRDLKPGNIIITKNGAKTLDFGLAKLGTDKPSGESAANIETVTEPITRAGAVLGTLFYMSPEQVEGKDADERSDIFSFGALFYEMITGQRPFSGDTQAAVLASVLKDQPQPMSQVQPAVPRALERVVRKCLEKKPDDRWHSARDLKPTLELIDLDAPAPSTQSSSVPIPVQSPSRKSWLWPSVAAVAVLAVAGAGYVFWPNSQPSGRVTRFESALPDGVTAVNPNGFYIRVSPDGSKLAFTLSGPKGGIFVRELEAVKARLLPGTEGAIAPAWSPDGRSLAYANGQKLMRVEVAGGPPQQLCEVNFNVGSAIWTPDNQIVFGGRGAGALNRVSAAGGVPTPVTAITEGETFHSQPSLLPDNRHFLYLRTGGPKPGIYSGSLDNKPEQQPNQQVMPVAFGATFVRAGNSSGGDLFFVRDGTLMAQPFDPKGMHLTGDPLPVVQQIGTGTAHAHFSATSGGVMAYRTGPGVKVQLAWVDRKGNTTEKIGDPALDQSISLSPDEKQIAIFRVDRPSEGNGDIWLLDVTRNVESRLTTGDAVNLRTVYGPAWSPDSKQLAYASGTKIFVKDVGGATEARLVKDLGHQVAVTDWTRDGRFLIYDEPDAKGSGGDIRAIAVTGGEPSAAVVTEASEIRGRVSPDGRWIAYDSTRSGNPEVYVRPFAAPGSSGVPSGPVIQISRDGGGSAKWSADGKELFFRANGGVMSVAIEATKDTFRPDAPVATGIPNESPALATSRNNQRFLITQPLDRGILTPITIVTNWEAALKR